MPRWVLVGPLLALAALLGALLLPRSTDRPRVRSLSSVLGGSEAGGILDGRLNDGLEVPEGDTGLALGGRSPGMDWMLDESFDPSYNGFVVPTNPPTPEATIIDLSTPDEHQIFAGHTLDSNTVASKPPITLLSAFASAVATDENLSYKETSTYCGKFRPLKGRPNVLQLNFENTDLLSVPLNRPWALLDHDPVTRLDISPWGSINIRGHLQGPLDGMPPSPIAGVVASSNDPYAATPRIASAQIQAGESLFGWDGTQNETPSVFIQDTGSSVIVSWDFVVYKTLGLVLQHQVELYDNGHLEFRWGRYDDQGTGVKVSIAAGLEDWDLAVPLNGGTFDHFGVASQFPANSCRRLYVQKGSIGIAPIP